MKTKIVSFLLAGGLLALAAWLMHVPTPAQADNVPEKYRDTVHKGLEYLVKNQHKDGHWEGDGGQHPVAMTGLVGLALLMERSTERSSQGRISVSKAKYSANIRKAVDWLIEKSQAKRDGLIFSEHPSETARYMEGHGLTTLFLAGVLRDEDDTARQEKLTDVLIRAVKFIVKAQSSQGGWYDTSKAEGHDLDTISATIVQIQALQAAEHAGIPVPSETIDEAQEYLKKAIAKHEKAAKSKLNRSRPADTAAALACRCSTTRFIPPDTPDELREKWFKYCQNEIPVGPAIKFGRDEIAHYYYARAVLKVGGATWSDYRTAMFDYLQRSQAKDGSWPAGDDMSDGPVYTTAMWCSILQLEKRSHPLTRPPEPATRF